LRPVAHSLQLFLNLLFTECRHGCSFSPSSSWQLCQSGGVEVFAAGSGRTPKIKGSTAPWKNKLSPLYSTPPPKSPQCSECARPPPRACGLPPVVFQVGVEYKKPAEASQQIRGLGRGTICCSGDVPIVGQAR